MTTPETKTSKERDVLGRLADRGEDALSRLTELPGGSRVLKSFNDLKTRVDDLGRKARGIDLLETRVARLEKDVAALKKTSKPAPKRRPTKGPSATS